VKRLGRDPLDVSTLIGPRRAEGPNPPRRVAGSPAVPVGGYSARPDPRESHKSARGPGDTGRFPEQCVLCGDVIRTEALHYLDDVACRSCIQEVLASRVPVAVDEEEGVAWVH
jgi:hypothetical protein